MNIKGIYTFSKDDIVPVDRWRLQSPFNQLEKNTDWNIELTKQFLAGTSDEIKNTEIQSHVDTFKDVDLVWSSYYSNKMQYAFTKLVENHSKTRFVMDVDDNIYQVPAHNPFWLAMNADLVHGMQRMVETVTHLVTTNERLADTFREMRLGVLKDSVYVIPNYIDIDKYTHEPFDNGDIIKIGYFGGSSHYADLNKTNFGTAVSKILHKHKNVHFELYGWWGKNKRTHSVVGTFLDENLPTKRVKLNKGAKGHQWYELFKTINLDVACGPLVADKFNEGKSDIKWQESAIMGAAFIGSRVGPYRDTIQHNEDGLLVNNTTQEWYDALDELITNATKRKKLATNARQRVLRDFTIQNNWTAYKDLIERIVR